MLHCMYTVHEFLERARPLKCIPEGIKKVFLLCKALMGTIIFATVVAVLKKYSSANFHNCWSKQW